MRNPGLEEAQAGIKIAGINTNNLRYADDTTLMAESEELTPGSSGYPLSPCSIQTFPNHQFEEEANT